MCFSINGFLGLYIKDYLISGFYGPIVSFKQALHFTFKLTIRFQLHLFAIRCYTNNEDKIFWVNVISAK